MITKPKSPIYWLILAVFTLGLLVLTTQPTPARADNPLPPRDTPTPTPNDKGGSDKSRPVGAYIELVAPGAPAGAWAVVQWQDSAGGWQNVEGWQGPVVGSSRWWVHAKDFGSGPFRWQVLQRPGGSEWGVSEPFKLPTGANETLRVTVEPPR